MHPCGKACETTEDSWEVTTVGVSSGAPESGASWETRLSCDIDGVEVLSAGRGRALATGRNTVLPFSVRYVGVDSTQQEAEKTYGHGWS